MSMVLCSRCDAFVDSDDDPECFVEVGNMRRLHKTIVLCEACRDLDEMMAEEAAASEAAMLEELERHHDQA